MVDQAKAGLALMAQDAKAVVEGDVPAATLFKESCDSKIAELETQVAALAGKDNKKARTEKEKEKTAIKNDKQYIDACKVVKGLPPVHGSFAKAAPAAPKPVEKPAAAAAVATPVEAEKKKDEKKDKPKKAQESTGISKEERAELESIKAKIIEKKGQLKEAGMSGGQQNKDSEIVAWVSRMNELKEKEAPGSSSGKDKKPEGKKKNKNVDNAMLEQKQKELDEYADNLRTEFKYSKKEVIADPEYQEMKAELDKLSK